MIGRTLFALFALSALAGATLAQDEPALRRDWIEKDLRIIERIQRVLPPSELLPARFREQLGSPRVEADESTGFAGRREHLAVYGGYTTLWIRTLIDDTREEPRYAAVVVECSGHRDSWPRIVDELRRAWELEVVSVPDERTLRFEWRDTERVRALQGAMAKKLGPSSTSAIPDELAAHYALLLDPLEFYDFGEVCYYAGVEPFPRTAMNALVAAERWDLVHDVLRSLNPTARVYAAEALLKRALFDPSERAALRAVRALPLPISSCEGCVVTPRAARELLPPIPE